MILPNQLTVLRIILTPIFVWLFLSDSVLLNQISFFVYVVAAITDWYDGWLARKFNYITKWGEFLDPLADKILTSSAFLVFAAIDVLELWMVIVIIVRDFLMTGLRLYADMKKKTFTTSSLAKWKTFIQMGFIYYLLGIFTLQTVNSLYYGNEKIFNTLTDSTFIYFTMLVITILTLFTGVSYLYKNRLLIKSIFSFETKSN
ncbi:MAG: CDP-diacylglycerol--glycerol-3-phosphate 3-phosphatidyltransferase [Ignavibacteriae bacterium]|nr:CDP-diacylglycerol--glycerol-3-phosphate 3-phosphatidyltransferase [Ignavibacteriota bacterium]NOG98252.1 CDP-diacylglycerol--glycerol-3-phosphate 3-phosphatidyltransferase [Ignavibacteriota bacterium]